MNSLKPGKVYYSRRQRPLSLLHRYSRSRRNKRALEIVGQWWNEKREKRKKERKGKRREEKKINKERKKERSSTFAVAEALFLPVSYVVRTLFNPSHASLPGQIVRH